MNYRLDGYVQRYKSYLVTKDFSHTYDIHASETFSPIARLNSIRIHFSFAVNLNCPIFQLDIRSAFFYGDLHEMAYMEQPPGMLLGGECGLQIQENVYGLEHSSRA